MLARNLSQSALALNNVYPSPVSINDCVTGSINIYKPIPSSPEGWNLFAQYEDTYRNYRGVCYAKNLLTPDAQLLFVHRGTILAASDVIGDVEIAFGHIPLQLESAKDFAARVLDKIVDLYQLKNGNSSQQELVSHLKTTHTGHSMGAIIADCFAAINIVPSITFENPGSKPIVQEILNNMKIPADQQIETFKTLKSICIAYQAGVNIINSCNEQIAKTFRVNTPYTLEGWRNTPYFPFSSSYYWNTFYLISNTCDQHAIATLYQQLLSPSCVTTEIQNPYGFNAGYVDYLDEKNSDYWKQYFTFVWDNNPAIHGDYNNDINVYFEKSFAQLKLIQKEAKGVATLHYRANPNLLFTPQVKPRNDLEDDFVVVNSTPDFDETNEVAAKSGCVVM